MPFVPGGGVDGINGRPEHGRPLALGGRRGARSCVVEQYLHRLLAGKRGEANDLGLRRAETHAIEQVPRVIVAKRRVGRGSGGRAVGNSQCHTRRRQTHQARKQDAVRGTDAGHRSSRQRVFRDFNNAKVYAAVDRAGETECNRVLPGLGKGLNGA